MNNTQWVTYMTANKEGEKDNMLVIMCSHALFLVSTGKKSKHIFYSWLFFPHVTFFCTTFFALFTCFVLVLTKLQRA